MTIQELLKESEAVRHQLERKAEGLRLQETLKDIDAKRADLDRQSSLFEPSRQRLERGGKALELGEAYEGIKELRTQRVTLKQKQSSIRDELTRARTELQNAEEALTLIEGEYREKLTEQTRLENTAQRVKALDAQIIDRQEAAAQARKEFEAAEAKLKECTSRYEERRKEVEKLEVALREARKYLQVHAVDEKLSTGLAGIQKCYAMYEEAEEKRTAVRESLGRALEKKQEAQRVLNDRAAMMSEVNHRYMATEKEYSRTRAFYESTLKGRSISEWREICAKNIKRLSELDELYKKFQELRDLEEKLKNLHEARLRIQQETRSLNIRDVEQSGKIQEMQDEVERLEKRVALLHRIEDLDAVRELLQDGAPCPLCGSMTHPYTSGALVPNPEEVHRQLAEAQKKLDDLRDEITTRQTRTGRLNEEITSITRDETDMRNQVNALNAEISSRVSMLGLRFGAGISPFEELDRARQKTRDSLQLARNAADTAEAAERDMKAAEDELDKITQTRSEVTRFHQDALFALQSEKSGEEQFTSEAKNQEEIVHTLKSELLSQIMPYGYKAFPDKNPAEVVEALAKRLADWQEGAKRCDELERELSASQSGMTALKKERESLRLNRDELASRVKAVEAERDSVKQQRVILFASRVPDDETSRAMRDVEELRRQFNERHEVVNAKSQAFDQAQTQAHSLETQGATLREALQKAEISFSKQLLALGFRNEDDYAAALLTNDERRDLHNKLRTLNQTASDLQVERENTRSQILELQAGGVPDNSQLVQMVRALNAEFVRIRSQAVNDADDAAVRAKLTDEVIPALRDLMLTCGLEEVLN